MTLSNDIKEKFFKVITGDISLEDFEQWAYSCKELENYLGSDGYLDLISLSFKKSSDKYELRKFLQKYIDNGELETYKMLKLLKKAQQKNEKLPYILIEFYDLYCKGYEFLHDLGLVFGLAVAAPTVSNSSANTWDELTKEQQNELLNSFSPELEKCIEQVIYWLETKRIILTGEQNEMEHYCYKDFRAKVVYFNYL